MVRKKIVMAALVGVWIVPTLFLGLTSVSSQNVYDPFADIDGNGEVDAIDAFTHLAPAYGTTGDPTRPVNVTNWPESAQVVVWYNEPFTPNEDKYSDYYDTHGFSTLHILASGSPLASGETITIYVWGTFQNPSGPGTSLVVAHTLSVASGSATSSVTIPVPSKTVRFWAEAGATTTANLWFTFYLTWA